MFGLILPCLAIFGPVWPCNPSRKADRKQVLNLKFFLATHLCLWFWQVLYGLGWFHLVCYVFIWNRIVWSLGAFKVLYSLGWYFKVMESLIWPPMVCMILCGRVLFSVVFYNNVGSQIVLYGYVWSCMALRSYAKFLSLFLLLSKVLSNLVVAVLSQKPFIKVWWWFGQ